MGRESSGGFQRGAARPRLGACVLAALLAAAGCNSGGRTQSSQPGAAPVAEAGKSQEASVPPAPVQPAPPPPVTIPAGAVLRVRLGHAVSTGSNRPGDRFSGTLDADVVVDGKTVLPKGAEVRGTIKESDDSGRLRGRAVLALALESVVWKDRVYPVATDTFRRVSADHKKRNLALVGGGSGVGALIGGIAGGGRGALIGAGAGAAAGTAGAAATGKRQIRMPAESVLGFRLREPLRIEG